MIKHKIVAIVGMAGSGKSEVAGIFTDGGFTKIRFGDITDKEIKKRGLELNEASERLVREELRREHGMAVYAKLSLPDIEAMLKTTDVVVDGLYSWEEYILLKKHHADSFLVVAVWSSPKKRYARLAKRAIRPLTQPEAVSRDCSEIENSKKGGPIAMADFTVINESSLEDLKKETLKIIRNLK